MIRAHKPQDDIDSQLQIYVPDTPTYAIEFARQSGTAMTILTDAQATAMNLYSKLMRLGPWLTKPRLEVLFHISRLWFGAKRTPAGRLRREAFAQNYEWACAAAALEEWTVQRIKPNPGEHGRCDFWTICCGDRRGYPVEFDAAEWGGDVPDPVILPATKRCSACAQELPISRFSPSRVNASRVQSRCKVCMRVYHRERSRTRKQKAQPAAGM